jgi:hypothetical protein
MLQGRAQGLPQAGALGVRIAVDVHDRQLLQPFPTQALRQAIGVLHGIQLDEPGGVGDVIGRQGQNFGADQPLDQMLHRLELRP